MAHKCVWDVCGKAFADKKSLSDHTQTVHMNYVFYCCGCGDGPWTNRSTVSVHRRKNPGCKDSKSLTFRPGQGFFFRDKPYLGDLPVALQATAENEEEEGAVGGVDGPPVEVNVAVVEADAAAGEIDSTFDLSDRVWFCWSGSCTRADEFAERLFLHSMSIGRGWRLS